MSKKAAKLVILSWIIMNTVSYLECKRCYYCQRNCIAERHAMTEICQDEDAACYKYVHIRKKQITASANFSLRIQGGKNYIVPQNVMAVTKGCGNRKEAMVTPKDGQCIEGPSSLGPEFKGIKCLCLTDLCNKASRKESRREITIVTIITLIHNFVVCKSLAWL